MIFDRNEIPDDLLEFFEVVNEDVLTDTWRIATHAFSEAHFATFPPALAETCIKAGTSEKGACSICGAPWVRVFERAMRMDDRPQAIRARELFVEKGLTEEHRKAIVAVGITDVGKARVTQSGTDKNTPEMQALAAEAKAALGGYYREFVTTENRTTGWAPSCSCDADVVPCVVLDPFGGSGTTGMVADRLGRDALLIELNPEYIDIGKRRITNDAPLFASVEVA